MRAFLVILTALVCAAPSSALQLMGIGAGAPKITVYRPCETQVVVYDARPEMGVSFEVEKPAIGALDAVDVRIARVVLDLSLMETTDKPGLYDSAYLGKWDKLIEECRARGVCLDVTIKGTPPGTDTKDPSAMCARVARFAADMAARYPSVAYWELGDDMNACLSIDRSDLKANDLGRLGAQFLKSAYPTIKIANPAAQVVCLAQTTDFLKGVYEGGASRCFDVALIKTDSKGLVAAAADLRKPMSANGDATKPLWCVYKDGFEHTKLETAFAANNDGGLYQKVLVEKTGPVEESKWLPDARVNAAIDAKPRNTSNVFVPTKQPMVPLGYDYREVDGGIEVQRVVVDTLIPAIIQLRYAPEYVPTKPGGNPSSRPGPAPRKTDDRHTPDPWDI